MKEVFARFEALREFGDTLPDKDIQWAVRMLEDAYEIMAKPCSDPYIESLGANWLKRFRETTE